MNESANRTASGVLAAFAPAALLGALSLAGASVSLYRVIMTSGKTGQDTEA